jgi:hypothetical protein
MRTRGGCGRPEKMAKNEMSTAPWTIWSLVVRKRKVSLTTFNVGGQPEAGYNRNSIESQRKVLIGEFQMTFKNEKMSEQDRAWVSKLVNYDSIRAVSRWIHKFKLSSFWTADHERHAFFIGLGGGGSPDDEGRLPYAVLVLDGEVVVFNLTDKSEGTLKSGLHYEYCVRSLTIPAPLKNREAEIRELIEQALHEDAFFAWSADGGTITNPNLTARKNILSCVVTFKSG